MRGCCALALHLIALLPDAHMYYALQYSSPGAGGFAASFARSLAQNAAALLMHVLLDYRCRRRFMASALGSYQQAQALKKCQ